MTSTFGSYESGQIRITDMDAKVSVSIRWPFDRDLDEWIDTTVELERRDIRSIGDGETLGVLVRSGQGYLELKPVRDGRFQLLVKGRNSLQPVEAQLIIPGPVGRGAMEKIISLG